MHATDPVSIDNCDRVEGLSVPSDKDTHAGMSFKGEAGICATGVPDAPSHFLGGTQGLQDLKAYFSRPTLIARGSLSASPGALYNLSASWSAFATEIPNFANRLRGLRGIRANLVYTIEHNANPFQQGLLVGSFQYGSNQFLRCARPSMCTHLPHVRLNVSENTMARLTIPYLSEFEYWGSSDSEIGHSMGIFTLMQVLGTPSLPNSATPVFKVYVHFEDIEVFGHVPLLDAGFVVPQSGLAAMPKGKSTAESELEANGRFSGVLQAASRLPTAVGNFIPSLKPFTAPASWFLAASARAASAFGFSKPVITSAPFNQVRMANLYEGNCDVPAPAVVCGAFQSNSVALTEANGGTDLDEMAFDTILTRYSQIFRGSITTTLSHADCVYASHVALSHMWFRSPPATTNGGNISLPKGSTTAFAVIPSTLMYFGQHFKYWHGGLKYRVTFAKSKFHTGRVQFSFIPNYRQVGSSLRYSDVSAEGGPVPPVFNTDLQASQSTIVFDLKDDSVFEFEVPYIAPTSHLGYNDSMGFVSMQIMDPLIANGESASTISFIVEVCAMPGFYFAGVASPGQPVAADNLGSPAIEFQSGVTPNKDASQYSVGEKFMSAKQLAAVPIWRRVDQTNATVLDGIIPPWHAVSSFGIGDVLAANTQRSYPFSRSGIVAQCYAYGIGSTLLCLDRGGLNQASRLSVSLVKSDNNTATTGTVPGQYNQLSRDPNTAQSVVHGNSGVGQFMLPTLCSAPRFRLGDFNTNTATRDYAPTINTVVNTSQTVKSVYQFAAKNVNGASTVWYWAVSAADDARCFAYLGPCPLVLANSTSTAASWYSGDPY
jgi:hypothetical protein